jgi:membrane protein implicated in regulation of membrane protease activity
MFGMSAAVTWWVLAGLLVAAEMLTGTFYVLAFALGAAAAAIAAHLGAAAAVQLIAAALVAGIAAMLVPRLRRGGAAPATTHDPGVVIDIGQRVLVEAWPAEGVARVGYRGATWSVRFQGTGPPAPGEHRIVGIEGSTLLVERA